MKIWRAVPPPKTLREATETVIERNSSVGYVPTDFIKRTRSSKDFALLEVCQNLIMKAETLQWLEQALTKHPGLLTLEDLVLRSGEE